MLVGHTVRRSALKSASGYTIQRPLELCRDLEIVKQSVKESPTPQPGTQCAEPTSLDDVTKTPADNQDDEVKEHPRVGDTRNDNEETSTTSSTTSQQMQHKAQHGTQRQAAASARTANQLLQQYEHEMF